MTSARVVHSSRWIRGFVMRASLCGCLALVILLSSPTARSAAESETELELKQAEQTLKGAKIATDGPSLVQYFKQRTLTKAERDRLATFVPQLGDESFRLRQKAYQALLKGGRSSLPFLRSALNSADVQIARTAQKLVVLIDSGAEGPITAAAARVLADRKGEGAIPALMAFLPLAADSTIEEAIFSALAGLAINHGKVDDHIVKALTDKEPLRRMAAASVMSRAAPEHRLALRVLLKDKEPRVRLKCADVLVRAGDKAAVDVLIDVLSTGPKEVSELAEEILYLVAGDTGPQTDGVADDATRAKAKKAWQAWWKSHSTKIDLAKIGQGTRALRGLTVIIEHDGNGTDGGGRIWECGRDGKVRWEITSGLRGPLFARMLANGRLLIAEYNGNKVVEKDKKGKELWSHNVGTNAVAAQRLRNGNTFIASRSSITEINREGKVIFQKTGIDCYRAHKLPNNHILYASGTQMVELDAKGAQVVALNLNGISWGDANKLPNGRYLVSLYSGGRVVEIDKTGKEFWSVNVNSPTRAIRLPNGNTLVSSSEARFVAEYDRKGKEVWKQTTKGRVWWVSRY